MNKRIYAYAVVLSILFASLFIYAQQSKPGVLGPEEVKKAVPAAFFFAGQSAPVQLRNSGGFRAGNKLVLAGLVDASGYASDVKAKYQGFLITEVKLNVEGTNLPPGQYGFGFLSDGKFLVMDVGQNELASVSAHVDENLHRPVPLKLVAEGDAYRLYAGKKYVTLKAE